MENKEPDFVILDKNGMVVEKSANFNKNNIPNEVTGYMTDIIQKSRELLDNKSTINSIEIFFENQVFVIKDNCSANLNIISILDNK